MKAKYTERKRLKRHARNKARERWNYKEEINKGPTTDNGVGASFLEIRIGIFSKSVTLWLLAILQQLPRATCAHMCTWFSASWRCFRYDRKCLFSCIYNHQTTISPTSLFSANFDRNRVKNHPKPWTCPLTSSFRFLFLFDWVGVLWLMMMNWCLMSSDVSWHIRDKLWPMPKHGSIILYVHGNQKARS